LVAELRATSLVTVRVDSGISLAGGRGGKVKDCTGAERPFDAGFSSGARPARDRSRCAY
jgi:hypothetical protein